MSLRRTITIDADVAKAIQKIRGESLIKQNINLPFTSIINQILRIGLKHYK